MTQPTNAPLPPINEELEQGTSIGRFAEPDIMPSMIVSVHDAKVRLDELKEFIRSVMVEELDYGKLPGMNVYTLYRPGAEKLLEVYGYAAYPRVVLKTILMPNDPNNPFAPHGPYICWDYAVDIYSKRTGAKIGIGVGSCNSMEAKYRWRDAQRACPNCGATALIPGKPEFAKTFRGKKHWHCLVRKSGCGAEFDIRDPKIIDQVIGKIPNDDVWSLMNTIQKMAKKRALVDGAIAVTRSSGMFVPEPGDGDDDAERDQRGATRERASKPQNTPRQHRITLRGQPIMTAGIEAPTYMAIQATMPTFDAEQGAGTAMLVMEEKFGILEVADFTEVGGRDYLAILRRGVRPQQSAATTSGANPGEVDDSDIDRAFGSKS